MEALPQVVITGVGVVSPVGVGKEAFWDSFQRQQSGVRPIDQFAGAPPPVQIAAELADFDPRQYVHPRKALKVMSPEIRSAFAAARLAADDADLLPESVEPQRLGVVLGSEPFLGDVQELAALYQSCVVDGQFVHSRFGQQINSQLPPLWLLSHLPNMAACHIGIAFDAQGPNNSIVLGDVSSLTAIIEAASVIQRGAADVMFTGGTGCRLNPTLLVRLGDGDLSRRTEPPEAASRPFDADRDGMVVGEGACVFVLERREHAERRGAEILARLAGFGRGMTPAGEPLAQGTSVARAIAAAMRHAEFEQRDVGHVNAHGVSTIGDDAAEARAIRDTLDDVPVTAPKSMFGNLGAGSGAVEAAVSVMALTQGEVPPTLNYRSPDPRCPVQVVRDEPLRPSASTALILNHAPTGQAAAVALAAM